MKILLTGADGQLGRAIQESSHGKLQILPFGRDQLDITDPGAIQRSIDQSRPDIVVNAAGYTSVDKAETEVETAFRVNRDGPAILAANCASAGVALIHLSTDFVFDGEQQDPYRPGDPTNPINVYGASKLAGEEAVLSAMPDALIVRSSWLYGIHGRNFVTNMLRLLKENGRVRVVADQFGTPTNAPGLAEAILIACKKIRPGNAVSGESLSGIRHHADAGIASWHELALAVRNEAVKAGTIPSQSSVEAIATQDYPTPARRPRFSALDATKFHSELGLPEIAWTNALAATLRRISQQSSDR